MILITGCGFIGLNTAKAFANEDRNIICTYLKNPHNEIRNPPAKLVKLDITKPIKLNERPNAILHTAAVINTPDKTEYKRVNVEGTRNVLEFARKNDCKVVFCSTCMIYDPFTGKSHTELEVPKPSNIYAKSKLMAEKLCEQYSKDSGIETILLRYASVYGPNQRRGGAFDTFIKNAYASKPIIVQSNDEWDYVYIEDITLANKLALKSHETGVFNIGSGKSVTVKKLANSIAKEFNANVLVNKNNLRKKSFALNIKKAKSKLGYHPKTSLSEGIIKIKESMVT